MDASAASRRISFRSMRVPSARAGVRLVHCERGRVHSLSHARNVPFNMYCFDCLVNRFTCLLMFILSTFCVYVHYYFLFIYLVVEVIIILLISCDK